MLLSSFPDNCASRILSGWNMWGPGMRRSKREFKAYVNRLLRDDFNRHGRCAFVHAIFTTDQLESSSVLRNGLAELGFAEIARRRNPKTGSVNVVFLKEV